MARWKYFLSCEHGGNKEVVEVLVQSYHQVVAQLGSDW